MVPIIIYPSQSLSQIITPHTAAFLIEPIQGEAGIYPPGGGLLPISLFMAKDEVMNVFHPGEHGSTFGGPPPSRNGSIRGINHSF